MKIVIADKHVSPVMLAEFFPGFDVARPGDAFTGRRFDRIVSLVPMSADPALADWFNCNVSSRLKQGVDVEWLA